jgi:hypothetical protein
VLLLHDRAACFEHKAELEKGYYTDDDENEDGSEAILVTTIRDEEFDHGYTGYMSLLRTCRQLYHEAAGVLYGSNTFLFSCVPCPRVDESYCPTNSAATWFDAIGSQILLVRRVLIDAESFRSDEDAPATMLTYLNILPILRVV